MKFYPRKWTKCQIISGSIIAALGIFVVAFIPWLIGHIIYNELMLDGPTASGLSNFIDRPTSVASVYNSYYIYHVANPDDIVSGRADPIVIEKGPYTYRMHKWHPADELVWRANATMEYIEHNEYFFEPSMSSGSESDIFTTINMGYVGALNTVQGQTLVVDLVKLIIAEKNIPFFLNLTVAEILWGYNNTLLETLHTLKPEINPVVALQVKNDANDVILPAAFYTGGEAAEGQPIPPSNSIMKMTMWNGMQGQLNYWNTSYANMINGTDGTSFHPKFESDEQPPCFVDVLYRSVVLSGCGDTNFDGIKLLCLHLRDDMLLDGINNPDNAPFYMTTTGFLPFPPAVGQPIHMSLPHFHRANWSSPLVNKITFVPDNHWDSNYDTVLYVEPFTGQLFQAHKRLQVNTFITPGVTAPANVSQMYFPVIWIDQHADPTDSTISKFKTFVYLPYYGSIVLGSVSIFGGLLLLVVAIVRCTCWVNKRAGLPSYEHDYSPLGTAESMRINDAVRN